MICRYLYLDVAAMYCKKMFPWTDRVTFCSSASSFQLLQVVGFGKTYMRLDSPLVVLILNDGNVMQLQISVAYSTAPISTSQQYRILSFI